MLTSALSENEVKALETYFSASINEKSYSHNGLSRHGLAISVNDNLYFIKRFDDCDDEGLLLEKHVSQLISRSEQAANLTPKLVANIGALLIYEFVEHQILADINVCLEKKIETTTNRVALFHQLNKQNIQRLNIKQTTRDLLASCQFPHRLNSSLKQYIDQLPLSNNDEREVLCHGDLNFANIIKPLHIEERDNGEESSTTVNECTFLLIDFESSCVAHPAFDIAMCIAINRLDRTIALSSLIDIFLNNLRRFNKSLYGFSYEMVMRYLPYCYLINSLWYFAKAKQRRSSVHRDLAMAQIEGLTACFKLSQDLVHEMRQEANKLRLTTMHSATT